MPAAMHALCDPTRRRPQDAFATGYPRGHSASECLTLKLNLSARRARRLCPCSLAARSPGPQRSRPRTPASVLLRRAAAPAMALRRAGGQWLLVASAAACCPRTPRTLVLRRPSSLCPPACDCRQPKVMGYHTIRKPCCTGLGPRERTPIDRVPPSHVSVVRLLLALHQGVLPYAEGTHTPPQLL